MTQHIVDPSVRNIESEDLATWLLFFLESHGATITLAPNHGIHVNLDTMPGLDAVTAERWAPTIAILLPDFREILLARTPVQVGDD